MAEMKNLHKFHEEVRSKLEPYLHDLIASLGDNLRSVVVYGSAAGPDYVPKKSNVNLLVICREVKLETLQNSLKIIKKGRKKGIVAPLFLTDEHMRTSSDVFPIEFLEMRDGHTLVYGEEVFAGLQIGFENLRLECEEQLKGMLIRLRQAYLEVGSDAKALTGVILDSISSLVPVLRGILRLLGDEPPRAKAEVVDALTSKLNVGSGAIRGTLAMKLEGAEAPGGDLAEHYDRYMGEIERIAMAVDRLQEAGR
jgi:hypothetical protein